MLRLVSRGLILLCALAGASPVSGQIPFEFAASAATIDYDPADGIGSTSVSSTIEELPGPAYPHNALGFAMAVVHDPALIAATLIDQGAHLASLAGGAGPAFFNPSIQTGGITVGVIFDFLGQVSAVYTAPSESLVVHYASVPSTWLGDVDGGTATLVFQAFGAPLTQNVVVVAGASNPATGIPGSIELIPTGIVVPQMLRGDANDDGAVIAIADAIAVLNQLFLGAPPSACLDAADVNADGSLNIADPIVLLAYGFSGGPPPSPPFPDCGPFVPALGCIAPPPCP